MTASPTNPQWPIADALRRAREAARLVNEHDAAITPLLDAGLLARLVADRALLGDESAAHAMTAQKTATGAKHDAVLEGHDLVMIVRDIVKSEHAPEALRRAVGIGDSLRKDDAAGTAAALASIVEHGDELLSIGIAATTIADAKTFAAAIGGKKDAQSDAQTSKRTTTEQRLAAHLRLEAAVHQIARRAVQAFRTDPLARARLQALVSNTGPHLDSPPPDETPKS